MPMTDETTRMSIVYNGETYNFRQLRDELSACGHVFHSRTDTEVVTARVPGMGRPVFERFVGMFAFAIYDCRTGR